MCTLYYYNDLFNLSMCYYCCRSVIRCPLITLLVSINLTCNDFNALRCSSIASCLVSSSFNLIASDVFASSSYWFFMCSSVYLYNTLSFSAFNKNISSSTFVFSTNNLFFNWFCTFYWSIISMFFIDISSTIFVYFALSYS